jgi:hypothetical protein
MKKIAFTALSGALLCASAAEAQDRAPITAIPGAPVIVRKAFVGSTLPANSDVWVSLDSAMSSKHLKMGEKFDVTVARDVMDGDYIVIPRGTHGHGHVSYRTGKGAFGKSAKMEFDITDVELGDRSIPLSGHYRIEGNGNTGATVGTVVAVGALGGVFITGHSATANQGSEWKAATKEPILIALADAVQQNATNPQPTMSSGVQPAAVQKPKNATAPEPTPVGTPMSGHAWCTTCRR